MLKKDSKKILEKSKSLGWVLEPDAKALMKLQGLDIPDFILTNSFEIADLFLKACDGPVVAKAVSKKILHKTEHDAVVTGIFSSDHLKTEMTRLQKLDGCENILVEHMVKGLEIIIGAKNDFQFGPVIVFGIGGTSVEIYNDTAIRMAPIKPEDVFSMTQSLKAKEIITGYRGRAGVNMEILAHLMVKFSNLIMELENDIESVDLNPVICTKDGCVIADARIILQTS
ncbi:MAG: acetate--CoA ligase family protein [Deltaproteobacteria bacterium]|uniref:acetate--CoA ligase family protein n=1 Tax=Desulfobacula sp. TaxID=2593537 RepID=UPI00199C220C|nr:acetate--CoA ligase family protein [Candidatus Desulfobacula maris]MBL6994940.1 acetate--CoA ligase family protein [Desulfobacula sp.]